MQDTPAPFSVLIIDAEPTICRVFGAKLTKEGRFQVTCASTGAEAYRAALQRPFDVLLWDLRLRDSDTIVPRLRALCPDAALLLMSTDDQPALSAVVASLDIAGILVKPFGLDTLETHVTSALTQRSRQQPLYQLGFVGQYVTIYTPAGQCTTRVFENAQDTFLVVGAPRVRTPPDFAVGLPVRVEYNGKAARYAFESTLLREIAEPLACWELAMPDMIRRHQRRGAVRTPLQKPIEIRTGSEPCLVPCVGTTLNISATGLALRCLVPLQPGTAVDFTIATDMTGQATVVWIQPETEETGATSYRLGLRFEPLSAESLALLEIWFENYPRLG
jgi:CheY-like chemotaxis protein